MSQWNLTVVFSLISCRKWYDINIGKKKMSYISFYAMAQGKVYQHFFTVYPQAFRIGLS